MKVNVEGSLSANMPIVISIYPNIVSAVKLSSFISHHCQYQFHHYQHPFNYCHYKVLEIAFYPFLDLTKYTNMNNVSLRDKTSRKYIYL